MSAMQVQSSSVRHSGVVKRFNAMKGYGFISSETALPDKSDVFVHYSGISAKGYRTLVENQEVEFSVEDGAKGPQATAVVVTRGEELSARFKKNKDITQR
jgi:CspA family cold shock protein